jgi:hypothetical protein
LTKLFFRYVLNPYLEGAIDRDDGLVVVWSTILWTVIAWIISLPELLPLVATASFAEVVSTFLSVTCMGIAWGAAIGAFLVVHLWLEVEESWEPTYGFAQVTQLPPSHYVPTSVETTDQPALSLDEVEELVVRRARQDAEEVTPPGVERGVVKTVSPAGSNGQEPGTI